MAIAQMVKVLIVTHRSQASQLLEQLQREGVCQILDAQEAMVSRDLPELAAKTERPKDIEELLNRLGKAIAFESNYAKRPKGLASVLAPRAVVDERWYEKVVSDHQMMSIIDQCEQTQARIERLSGECDNLGAAIEMLEPWVWLETPVEEIGRLHQTACLPGLIPAQHFEQTVEKLGEAGAAVQKIGTVGSKFAFMVFCLKDGASDVQKLLRSAEFEPVAFESMTGTVVDLISEHRQKLNETRRQLQQHYDQAASLSRNLLKLQVLHDHYSNLLAREQTRGTAPATEQTVILEGWVKQHDYRRLEKTVSRFSASSLGRIDPAEDEQIPVEIENTKAVRPFEVVTRLYGMPQYVEVDPTSLLAPFFALFFALCLTDAGYGIIIIALLAFLIKRMQGDKKLMWMLGICSAVTVAAGALMWFDPLEKPMIFFMLSLALGYVQLQFGILIAFIHNLRRQQYVAAACDQLTWLVMLNSIVALVLSKSGLLPGWLGGFLVWAIFAAAASIFLFSHREGGWGARLGMGFYQLFSTIFYVGDVLSYVRLMALGITTAGLAMAVNVVAKVVYDVPVFGIILAIIALVVGHLFNTAMSALSAFVHTLRLQYVEFFPKFLVGGGRSFEPLRKEYAHIHIRRS
ncbi:MAG: V-type ATP synthase subunit I [Planctomycetota bacterium]|jgi:V/A-type H+-transporting ATPase subunit I